MKTENGRRVSGHGPAVSSREHEDGVPRGRNQGRRVRPSAGRRGRRRLTVLGFVAGGLILLYTLTAFTEFPGLSALRDLWIETAMTTGEHQWLATGLFPTSVIEKVMSRQENQRIVVSTPEAFSTEPPKDEALQPPGRPAAGEPDELGNLVVIDDVANGLRVVELHTISFTGKAMFVDDPAQVVVAHTRLKGSRGQLITEYLEEYGAVAGINANGFPDDGGVGRGDDITGWSVSGGEAWGNGPFETYISMGFDSQDRLVVGNVSSFEDFSFRDLVQFKPALIIDGEIMVEGSAGWGIHPRTAIGQRADGSVMLVVIDGRKPGYSIGVTVGELAEIMQEYGVVNAGACDGGSSSVMAYQGELITRPSTPMEFGRYLPNAILVAARE